MSDNNQSLLNEPQGELVIRTVAMPADTNPSGDIFGGWLLSQMDLGGAITAKEIAMNRVTTVAITAVKFFNPVHVGDTVCIHANLLKIGKTSLTLHIDAWAVTVYHEKKRRLVTEADFTYVSIDDNGQPAVIMSDGRLME
ncbi:MAG: acyl-CoA thioesterase [Deltaproteobacteria bacterium]|nr:acyl-CoA thioesterase [Deltaproteobacteria bacterium]